MYSSKFVDIVLESKRREEVVLVLYVSRLERIMVVWTHSGYLDLVRDEGLEVEVEPG